MSTIVIMQALFNVALIFIVITVFEKFKKEQNAVVSYFDQENNELRKQIQKLQNQ